MKELLKQKKISSD